MKKVFERSYENYLSLLNYILIKKLQLFHEVHVWSVAVEGNSDVEGDAQD